MKPIDFKEKNVMFYGLNSEKLPALETDDGRLVSCWRLSIAERLKILITGRVWLGIRGQEHPPVFMCVDRPFEEVIKVD